MVERRSGPGAVRVEYRVGGKLPLLTTALGRVLLAHLPAGELAEVLADCTHPEDQAFISDGEEIDAVLAKVRVDGLARVARQKPEPLVALAAPIRAGAEGVAGALSLVVPGGVPTESIEPVLRAAVRGISRALR